MSWYSHCNIKVLRNVHSMILYTQVYSFQLILTYIDQKMYSDEKILKSQYLSCKKSKLTTAIFQILSQPTNLIVFIRFYISNFEFTRCSSECVSCPISHLHRRGFPCVDLLTSFSLSKTIRAAFGI